MPNCARGYTEDWRCRSKQPKNGDLVFIVSVGNKFNNGIVASGIVDYLVEEPKNSPVQKNISRRVYTDLKIVINPYKNKILETKYLKSKFPDQNWAPQASGIKIKDEILDEFIETWDNFLKKNHKEFIINNDYREGVSSQKLITLYERNPQARAECIKHYGYTCVVCEKTMEQIYGELGKHFIHVHHEKFISTFSSKHLIDPIKDLKTVCPNCHSMLHKKTNDKYLSIEELRRRLKASR